MHLVGCNAVSEGSGLQNQVMVMVFDHGEIAESTEQPFDECGAFLPARRSPSMLRSLLQRRKNNTSEF